MAGRIPQSFIDGLIARADIVEIISGRVPLKKSGREYKACCPFHDEKTPSFWVSPEKQFFHCFGCGAHGTVLGFLMQYDQLPFPEAVEELAARLGLSVPQESAAGSAPPRPDEALYALLARVAEHYHVQLAGNERARQYVLGRGLALPILERFQIGYAPDSWHEILRRFGTGEAAVQALQACGLVIERERPAPGAERFYDRFRDRIMFPIRDSRGRVIAFGGRVLDQGEPKYLNSPETELFHKGRELYGLYETRLARVALRQLLIVEGYMDVARLHQAGVQYAVATLGTATTPEHLRRAFRLVSAVTFAFDGDRAGRAAAWRALQNVLPEVKAGREIRFLFLPEGEDPDSRVGRIGAEAFEAELAGAQPLSAYLIANLSAQVDLSHADGKAHFIALARPLLEKVSDAVYHELLLGQIAGAIALDADRLRLLLTAPRGAAPAPPPPVGPAPGAYRAAPSLRVGRGGLLTQAIQALLHFPRAARQVPPDVMAALGELSLPGAEVLLQLLTALKENPDLSMAQLLERWRPQPEVHRRLEHLALQERLVPEQSAAERELADALHRLTVESAQLKRHAVLTDKPLGTLTDEERLELQSLTRSMAPVPPAKSPG